MWGFATAPTYIIIKIMRPNGSPFLHKTKYRKNDVSWSIVDPQPSHSRIVSAPLKILLSHALPIPQIFD